MKLQCVNCQKQFPIDEIRYRCECQAILEVKHDLEELKNKDLLQTFNQRLQENPFASGVWRYKELILPVEDENIITRQEGNTNLYSHRKINEYCGNNNIKLKHEGENPTGSFKDRGMTTGITYANTKGCKRVACASTGNTSASMASFASTGDFEAFVFVPEGKIAYGKLSQSLAYGAKTLQLQGDFDKAMNFVQEVSTKENIYLLNSINPFRIEGQKSISIEALHQLNWEVPDWFVVPGGNLGNSSAIIKAMQELKELKVIEKLPRIAVIQAQGANPLYQAYQKNFSEYDPVEAHTIATAIKIGNPVSYQKCVEGIKKMNGVVDQLSEQEILDAKAIVDSSGIGAEPASCCTVGGIRKLTQKGIIKETDKVVGILTGNLLKDPDATVNYHLGELEIQGAYQNAPIKMKPDIEEFRKLLNQSLH